MLDGDNRTFDCATLEEKRALYEEIYWWLRRRPSETELRESVGNLAARYAVDLAAFCKELCMDWRELSQLAADPLVTIGAHTVNHPMLAKLPEKAARSEMDLGRSVIEAALGQAAGSIWRIRTAIRQPPGRANLRSPPRLALRPR